MLFSKHFFVVKVAIINIYKVSKISILLFKPKIEIDNIILKLSIWLKTVNISDPVVITFDYELKPKAFKLLNLNKKWKIIQAF